MKAVNYDKLADNYDFRYQRSYQSNGLLKNLESIIQNNHINTVLEVGCGTGRWLKAIPSKITAVGVDRSIGMLSKAQTQDRQFSLIQGDCHLLPFKFGSFDLVFCINAIHHFENPQKFIRNCKNILKPGRMFVIVCVNPHSNTDIWFIYDYFRGTLETDLQRFPSPNDLEGWLIKAGFKNIEFNVGEKLQNTFIDDEVFPIPKDYTSQLSLLSDQEYQLGINKIEKAISLAKQANKHAEFKVDISLSMVTAYAAD